MRAINVLLTYLLTRTLACQQKNEDIFAYESGAFFSGKLLVALKKSRLVITNALNEAPFTFKHIIVVSIQVTSFYSKLCRLCG